MLTGSTFNDSTFFQDMADNIIERLHYFNLNPQRILLIDETPDILTDSLRTQFPHATFSALTLKKDNANLMPVTLNMPSQPYDLGLWPLMPNDDPYLCQLLSSLAKHIHPKGVFLSTSLAALTLANKTSAAQPPQSPSLHHLGDTLLKAGLLDPVMDIDTSHYTGKNHTRWTLDYPEIAQHLTKTASILAPSPERITTDIIYGLAKGAMPSKTLIEKDEKGRRFIRLNASSTQEKC